MLGVFHRHFKVKTIDCTFVYWGGGDMSFSVFEDDKLVSEAYCSLTNSFVSVTRKETGSSIKMKAENSVNKLQSEAQSHLHVFKCGCGADGHNWVHNRNEGATQRRREVAKLQISCAKTKT